MTQKVLHCIVCVTMQLSSTVTSKGQILIPVLIRNMLNINPFDRVTFSVAGSKIVAEKAATTTAMYGFVKTKQKLSNSQLESAINKATEEGLSQDL